MRIGYLVALVLGCTPPKPAATALANSTQQPPGLLTISDQRIGPIDGKSPATLTGLRELLVGFDVQPRNVDDSLQYHVFKNGEQVMYVVATDEGGVFNVHATSPKVTVADRAWRVGEPFHAAAQLTACECWGPNPTCYRKGDHVAVNFARSCDGLTTGDKAALLALDGLRVQRLIWSPNAFGDEENGSAVDAGDDGGD